MIPRMETLSIDPDQPSRAALDAAAAALERGGVVALPTETFYGLAADPWNEAAVETVYEAKGRGADMPLLLLLSDRSQASLAARELPALFEPLARRFWPGPLTLVVPAREDLPRALTAGRGTIGLRVPGLALPRLLAGELRRPLTGTSANRSGTLPARTAEELAASLGDGWALLSLILDGGPSAGGLPSTVVDLTEGSLRLIRPGAVPFEAVQLAASPREPAGGGAR